MTIVHRDFVQNGPGIVKMKPEEADDLWIAYNLILAGDTVLATAIREAERVKLKLEIRVEDAEISSDHHALVIPSYPSHGAAQHSSNFPDSSASLQRRSMVPKKDVALYGYGSVAWKNRMEECKIYFMKMSSSKSSAPVNASIQPLGSAIEGHFVNTLASKEVLQVRRNADGACFDVDSTVCLDEGIDELAEFCGVVKAVADWTARAVSGSIPFEEALGARLSLFNPSLSQIQDFLKKRPPRISPGVDELVKKLKAKSTDVYLSWEDFAR